MALWLTKLGPKPKRAGKDGDKYYVPGIEYQDAKADLAQRLTAPPPKS